MNALDLLRNILPHPTRTQHRKIGWRAIEFQIGMALPGDYEAFIDEYGLGIIDEFLMIYHPNTTNQGLRLSTQVQRELRALQIIQADQADNVPFAIFPAEGGLLPRAKTINGDACYWRTQSQQPGVWSVVVRESRGSEWAQYDGSMSEFELVSNLVEISDDPPFACF